MSTVIDTIERAQLRRVPEFRAGDRLRVHFVVIEGSRRRTQVFEGVAIKRQGQGVRETFTVRKQSFGVGVERTFPLHSPKIEKIEVAARGDVRRAKLYYLRDRVGKRARVRERGYVGPEVTVQPGLLHAVAEADEQPPEDLEGEDVAVAEADEGEDVAVAEAEPEAAAEEVAVAEEEPEAAAEEVAVAEEEPEAVAAEADDSASDEPAAAEPAVADEAGAEAGPGEDSGESAHGEPEAGSPEAPA